MSLSPYVPIIGLFALAAAFALFSVARRAASSARAATTGPSSTRTSAASSRRPQPVGGGRFPVKFYLTAMLFIIFDIEIIFLYPWAVSFDALGRLRLRGDGPVHRHGLHRLRLRVAARRPGLGLREERQMGIEEKLPTGILLTTVEKLVNWSRKSSLLGRHLRPGLLRHRDDGRRRGRTTTWAAWAWRSSGPRPARPT